MGMKKLGLWITYALLISALALPIAISAQQQPKFSSEDEKKAYELFYNAMYVEKDTAKGVELAKAFVEKYPNSEVVSYAKSVVVNKIGADFQAALTAYYQGSDLPKLEKLLSTGDEYLKWQPDQVYVTAQMALAASRGVLATFYKNIDRTKALVMKALKLMEGANPPENYPADQYQQLRENVLAQANQYMGYYELQQLTPDIDSAIEFLTKSTEVKSKEGVGWKDPNNYWLRASAYQKQYAKLSEEYRKLTDEEKTGEKGKALLDQINPLIDKMIDDYARVCAVAMRPETQELRTAAKQSLDDFWKYRYNNLPNGQNQLIEYFKADPTVAAPLRTPASAAHDSSAPPQMTATKPALSSTPAMANSNDNKSKPAPPKKKGKKRRG